MHKKPIDSGFEMNQMFELGDTNFLKVIVTVVNEVKQNVFSIDKEISREVKIIKMNQIEFRIKILYTK